MWRFLPMPGTPRIIGANLAPHGHHPMPNTPHLPRPLPIKVLSLIPPMTQLNTPYPSTAYLTGFLRSRGVATRNKKNPGKRSKKGG